MIYRNFGSHMTKYTLMAIEHISENTDPDVILELMERVSNFVTNGIITNEQYQIIVNALDSKTDYDVPEDYDTDGFSIEKVAQQVAIQGDAIDEIGGLLSELLPDNPDDQNEEA